MTDKLPISLVVITLNEAANLARCLRAADFCREIIVVDSGSTDGTLELAAEFGARILHRAWTGYRDQKNFGSAAASQPWVLCIDADEVVSPELRRSILETFRTEPSVDGFEINRHSIYAGRRINHGGWYPQWRLFLYRAGQAEWGGAAPHTTVDFKGNRKARLAGDLYHYTYADIRQHIRKNVSAAYDGAVAMHSRNRRATLVDFLLRGPWSFFRGYILQLGLLDGFYGFVIALSAGFYTFLKYAMLHEMNRRHRHQPLPDAVSEAKPRRG
jgi:glycosyltransferase involved in cell wall biosynthesis